MLFRTGDIIGLTIITVAVALVGFLTLEGTSGIVFGADQGTTTVSATVGEMIDCTWSTSTVSFGTLTSASVTSAYGSTTLELSANNSAFVKAYDAGAAANQPGLYYSGGPDTIGSATAAFADTATLSAGTEGYGIQVTTSTNITVNYRYENVSSTNIVGGLETSGAEVTMASSSAAVTAEQILIYHKAAVSASNVAGSYTDSLTFTCVSTL